jgi:hypothetical protein
MNNHDDPIRDLPDQHPEHLHPDLVAAIERARARKASLDMVARVAEKMLQLGKPVVRSSETQMVSVRRWNGRMLWAVSTATILFVAAVLSVRRPSSNESLVNFQPLATLHFPVYSSITTISLVEVGFQRIEEDLDRADAKAEEASEGLAQAAVRQEIQETLEKYYDWSW